MINWEIEDFIVAVDRTVEKYQTKGYEEYQDPNHCAFCKEARRRKTSDQSLCKACIQYNTLGGEYACIYTLTMKVADHGMHLDEVEFLQPRIDMLTASKDYFSGYSSLTNEDFIKFVEQYEESIDLERYEEPVRCVIRDIRSEKRACDQQ